MPDESFVSVIIPTWNRASTIGTAVASALNQTHSALEVLVCDDGSPDDSEGVVRAMTDPRVRWVPGAHGGQPAFPRNRGIAAAKGEWLAFLDDDDEWLPEKLARQLAAMRSSGRRASSTNAWRFVPGLGRQGALHERGDAVLGLEQLLADNRVIVSSAVIHRSLMADIEGFAEIKRLKSIEDYTLWLRVACLTEFDYLSEPHLIYRDDPKGSLRASDLDQWDQRMAVFTNLVGWCRRHPSEQTRRGLRMARKQLRIEKQRNPRRVARRAQVRRIGGRVLAALGLRRKR
jgi:glycosyltransferase involved in cell wall biosynthesis